MNIIYNERMIMCDIDDTLVMHDNSNIYEVSRYGPYNMIVALSDITVVCPYSNEKVRLTANRPMIKLVQEEAKRGAHIVFWSRGGYQWATAVVKALGLDNISCTVMSKPLVYFDDVPVEEWLKDRVYMPPNTIYKPS